MEVFIILVILLLILPTEFLRASSALHRTPTDPSHMRRHAEVSEPLGTQRWWHSDSYIVRGNAKFVTPMYKHTPMPPFCYGTVHIRVSSCEASQILQNGGTFFNVAHMQHLVGKSSIAGYIVEMFLSIIIS